MAENFIFYVTNIENKGSVYVQYKILDDEQFGAYPYLSGTLKVSPGPHRFNMKNHSLLCNKQTLLHNNKRNSDLAGAPQDLLRIKETIKQLTHASLRKPSLRRN